MKNTVILVGRLTRDIELRYTNSGKEVADFNLAVDTDKDHVDFLNIQAWGKLAKNLAEYTEKGDMIGVKGMLKHDAYTNKNGEKRSRDYVLVEKATFLSTKKKEYAKTTQDNSNEPYEEMGKEVEQDQMNSYQENDLPF